MAELELLPSELMLDVEAYSMCRNTHSLSSLLLLDH